MDKKIAFGQPKSTISPYGKHSEEVTEKELARRANKGKTKKVLLIEEYKRFINKAWNEERHLPEIKKVKVNQSNHRDKELLNKEMEFVGFIERRKISVYSSEYIPEEILVKYNGKEIVFPKWTFEPVILPEDLEIYLIRKEIYGNEFTKMK